MSIEKPISTIRKAVQGAAEEMASKESIQTPQAKHYDKAFLIFKTLRNMNPEVLEKLIIASAEGKELKDKLGNKLLMEFETISSEIFTEHKKKIIDEVKKIRMEKPSAEHFEKISALVKNSFTQLGNEIKHDSRLLHLFSGKEELFNEAVNYVCSKMPDLLVASI